MPAPEQFLYGIALIQYAPKQLQKYDLKVRFAVGVEQSIRLGIGGNK